MEVPEVYIEEFTMPFAKVPMRANLKANDALSLRAQGLSYREIAKKLNISKSSVGNYIQKALDELATQNTALAETIRTVNHRRLDMLFKTFIPKMKAGDMDAGQLVLKAIETEMRLFNVGSVPIFAGQQVINLQWSDTLLGIEPGQPAQLDELPIVITTEAEVITDAN